MVVLLVGDDMNTSLWSRGGALASLACLKEGEDVVGISAKVGEDVNDFDCIDFFSCRLFFRFQFYIF